MDTKKNKPMKKKILLLTLLALGAQANDFAFKLYGHLSQTEGNLFFSPASIEAALAMTAEGAAEQTLKQFENLLPQRSCFPNIGKSVTFENANAIWVDQMFPILGTFETAVTKKHSAEIRPANFVGQPNVERLKINSWVEQKTRNKIKDLLPDGSVNTMTRMILVNAIYFKGDWLHAFDPKKTSDAFFQTLENGEVQVPMMQLRETRFAYGENEFFQTLELPYEGEEVSMLLMLPKDNDDLNSFSTNQLPRMYKTDVNVFLPRFKVESTFDLKQPLADLGLTDAFDETCADFSGITGTQDLFIGAAVHKAFVEVNEEGTEAAAATGISIGVTSMPPPPKTFRADHPFTFLIRENTSGKILFMGRIVNPAG